MASRRDPIKRFAHVLVLLSLAGCGGGEGDPGDLGSVRGTVDGLEAAGLVLHLNGGYELAVDPSMTTFRFGVKLVEGTEYDVQIKAQPADQVCTVVDGSGTMPPKRPVTVSCAEQAHRVLGTVAGVASGETVELKLNDRSHTVTGSGPSPSRTRFPSRPAMPSR